MTTFSVNKEIAHLELCLHFVNTGERPSEKIHSYADLVEWAIAIHLLTLEQAQHLRDLAQAEPALATDALAEAISQRELIYRIILAAINGRSPTTTDLHAFNNILSQSLAHAQLTASDEGFTWTWPVYTTQLTSMLWPVLHATAELLTTPELLTRAGQCADDRGCDYLFLDLSKNKSRRWCDINDCGNRAKQRRYHQRQRQANQS